MWSSSFPAQFAATRLGTSSIASPFSVALSLLQHCAAYCFPSLRGYTRQKPSKSANKAGRALALVGVTTAGGSGFVFVFGIVFVSENVFVFGADPSLQQLLANVCKSAAVACGCSGPGYFDFLARHCW